ncbi:Bax inhibitor-1/YccA family protein [Mycoplasmatota bacterium WC30]
MRFRSGNPVLKNVANQTYISDEAVTYSNVAYKTVFLLALVIGSAFLTLSYVENLSLGILIGAAIVGLISVIVGTRSVRLSPIFASIYAVSEGIVLAVVSVLYASYFDGIVPTALVTTLIVLIIMLVLYSTRVIKVTQRFASIFVIALISVIIMSILSFILPFGGNLYYLIVVISAVLSAFFLLLDFKAIESCVESGADAKYGWVLSLGLLVTLVWIYIEMLRLLAIISRRR